MVVRFARVFGCIIFLGLIVIGCGKKGPPLPPLPNIPAQPHDWGIHIFDGEWWIWIQPPEANIDGTKPPQIQWVCIGKPSNTFSWKSCKTIIHGMRKKNFGNRWYYHWRPHENGCYVLALFNKKKKTAGPAEKRCITLPQSHPPMWIAVHARVKNQEIQLSLQSSHSRFAIYRTINISRAQSPQSSQIDWSQYTHMSDIDHIPGTTFVSWEDTDVKHKQFYSYLLRPLYFNKEKIRVEESSYYLPEIEYIDTFAPPSPQKGSIEKAEDFFILQWDAVHADDLAGYRIYVRTKKGWYKLTELHPTVTQYSVSLTTLKSIPELFSPYTFRITSYDTIQPPNESKGLLLTYQRGES